MTTTEKRLTFDDVIAAWTSESDRRQAEDAEAAQRSVAFADAALALLAQGRPVSHEAVARTSGLPPAKVEEFFAEVKERGGEFDESGKLVGLELTLNPTLHRFLLDGRTLYTWCALDAIFLPGLLGKTAEVESTCPETGREIRLTVTSDGVADYSPASTVLSITVPGHSCRREDDAEDKLETGPSSDSCGQMFFFASRAAGEQWLTTHPAVVLFTPEEAYELAFANWIGRRQKERSSAKKPAGGEIEQRH